MPELIPSEEYVVSISSPPDVARETLEKWYKTRASAKTEFKILESAEGAILLATAPSVAKSLQSAELAGIGAVEQNIDYNRLHASKVEERSEGTSRFR
jgi:hypothetical protein